eukprot:TRINITY_DN39568_c1_g1_i1.p1 TRINITY_DN39568_c1_g1~~TRINITY_DN39568_c1_g1_i1.p1  ORF type:complete len:445 (+),score=121.49 TRINITY_DN39568_c1_g1_i1:190-1524(+)
MAPEEQGFASLVRPELVDALHKMNIHAPNKVQADAIPMALLGGDLFVSAQTGSGKTLIFLLPILERLSEWPVPMSAPVDAAVPQPEALVLVPTLQLAMQIAAVAEQLAAALPTAPRVSWCGADSRDSHGRGLATGCRLLVTTPEGLLEALGRQKTLLDRLRIVSIDEADAILCKDRGAKAGGATAAAAVAAGEELLATLQASGRKLQYLLTMSYTSEAHEAELLERFPQAQQVLRVGRTGALVPTLRQQCHYFRGDREEKLLGVLRSAEEDEWLRGGTALVFCAEIVDVQRIEIFMKAQAPDLEVVTLHDELPAAALAAAFAAFQAGKAKVLVATDAAVRGLDFPLVRHVIMYDVAANLTAFVHSAGRTARGGQEGLVTRLVQTQAGRVSHFAYKEYHALQPAERLHFAKAPQPEGAVTRRQRSRSRSSAVELRSRRLEAMSCS